MTTRNRRLPSRIASHLLQVSGSALMLCGVDDASDFAGMLIAYPAPAEQWAFKVGTTGSQMAFEVSQPQGTTRGELKFNGSEAPVWQLAPAPVSQP